MTKLEPELCPGGSRKYPPNLIKHYPLCSLSAHKDPRGLQDEAKPEKARDQEPAEAGAPSFPLDHLRGLGFRGPPATQSPTAQASTHELFPVMAMLAEGIKGAVGSGWSNEAPSGDMPGSYCGKACPMIASLGLRELRWGLQPSS